MLASVSFLERPLRPLPTSSFRSCQPCQSIVMIGSRSTSVLPVHAQPLVVHSSSAGGVIYSALPALRPTTTSNSLRRSASHRPGSSTSVLRPVSRSSHSSSALRRQPNAKPALPRGVGRTAIDQVDDKDAPKHGLAHGMLAPQERRQLPRPRAVPLYNRRPQTSGLMPVIDLEVIHSSYVARCATGVENMRRNHQAFSATIANLGGGETFGSVRPRDESWIGPIRVTHHPGPMSRPDGPRDQNKHNHRGPLMLHSYSGHSLV